MRGHHFRERLLGLAMAEQQQLQAQEQRHGYSDWELSEDDVWGMGSFHGGALSMRADYGATDLQAAMDCSRSQASSGRSSSAAEQECEDAAAAAMGAMYIGEGGGAEFSMEAAGGRGRGGARSLSIDIRGGPEASYGEAEADDDDDDDEEEEEEDRDRLTPPHLMVTARQRRAMASSVVEGAGRTLKGRDLRNVRNAVWKQTGFYG